MDTADLPLSGYTRDASKHLWTTHTSYSVYTPSSRYLHFIFWFSKQWKQVNTLGWILSWYKRMKLCWFPAAEKLVSALYHRNYFMVCNSMTTLDVYRRYLQLNHTGTTGSMVGTFLIELITARV